jgi:arylsulfatase A-like enzyme
MITAYIEWRWIGRWIPGTIAALVLFSGACRHGGPGNSNPAPRDANLLLITLDTTRPDHLSCYFDSKDPGAVYRYARTPHLDALAKRGVRFLQATAQVPLTLPSHASIMTGEYPTRHGVRDNSGFSLSPSQPTISSRAQAHGYTTAAFVGCRVLARQFGLANGFTTYDDEMGGENERTLDLRAAPERRAGVVTDRALAWLKANGQKRFFLWVHYYDPHAPYDPPELYKHLYADDFYSGEIAYMDQEVGRLLHGVREMRLESRTLVTVLGDHGESLGEHGEVTHGVFLYESTLHIPMLMAGPDVPAGKIIDAQVRSIDVMPTLLEFLHIAPGKEAQGTSLWPLISRDIRVRSNYSYGETILPRTHLGWSELRSMRTDTWKLILAPRPELYNLEHDPAETENLITNHPADADQLQKHIWEAAGQESRREKVAVTPVDPQTREELESLGYIGAGTPREIQLGADAPDPKDRSSVLWLLEHSNELLATKDYAAAAHLLERASRLDPTNPRVHIKLAAAYEDMGQYPRAIRILNDAIAKHIETDRV